MPDIPGIIKPDLKALPNIRERMTFLYVERCLINRQDGAVTITDKRGTAYVPRRLAWRADAGAWD